MRNRCLFTGEKLNKETKVEHAIPESIGGRIKTRTSTSSRFNERCGDMDSSPSSAFAPMIVALWPLLPSSVTRSKRTLTDVDTGLPFRIGKDGIPVLKGIHHDLERKPGMIAIRGASKEALYARAEQMGHARDAVHYENEYGTRAQILRFPQPMHAISPVFLGSSLKTLLCVLDAVPEGGRELVGSEALRQARNAVLETVIDREESRRRYAPNLESTLIGFLPEPKFAMVAMGLREKFISDLDKKPFEHLVLCWSDSVRRTLFGALAYFGHEVWAFRLSTDWKGPNIGIVVANGILRQGGWSSANLHQSEVHRLTEALVSNHPVSCVLTARSAYRCPKEAGNLITRSRDFLLHQCVNHVELHADLYIEQSLSRTAIILEEKSGNQPTDEQVISRRLTMCFGETGEDQIQQLVTSRWVERGQSCSLVEKYRIAYQGMLNLGFHPPGIQNFGDTTDVFKP